MKPGTAFIASQSHACRNAEINLPTASCEMDLAAKHHELSSVAGSTISHPDHSTERLLLATAYGLKLYCI